jgi:hypothetical protein
MSLKGFSANLHGPEPWLTKVRLVLKNTLIKTVRRQRCCGNLGQAGC